MNRRDPKELARIMSTFFAILIFSLVSLLLLDYLEMKNLAPSEEQELKNLEEAVRTDAQISLVLTAERERQTSKSLEREQLSRWTRVILISSSVLFLISVNWFMSFSSKPVLPFEKLIDLRSLPSITSDDSLIELDLDSKKESELDLKPVERFINQYGKDAEAAIPILQEIQSHYGFLPDEALKRVCELTEISPAQIAGTSSFYAQFRRTPVGDHIVKLCHGTACHVSGIVPITEELERHLKIQSGADTDPTGTFTLDKVACLGCCSLAPVMMIDEQTVGRLTPASACQALHSVREKTPS